jgi:GntR family transcriptional regulator, sialic acid-inducible nan operon repressor
VTGFAFAIELAHHTGMMTLADARVGRKLSDDIRERLLRRIRRGEFSPGDALPSERELMQAYEVGRPAIREAMQDLQRLGLLDIRHGRRARVASPSINRVVDEIGETMRHVLSSSAATLEHFKEARFIFEMEMVRVAAKKRSASDIARLQATLEAQREASNDLERFVQRDGAFHREIAAISGNPIFPALMEAMFKWLAATYRGAVSVPGLEKLSLAEHGQILDGIASGNPDIAAKHMADHLNRANDLYRTAHIQMAS